MFSEDGPDHTDQWHQFASLVIQVQSLNYNHIGSEHFADNSDWMLCHIRVE